MPLSDTKIRNAKPKDKPYKLYDGDGLCLVVHPNGSRYWRLKYAYDGKEKTLAVGVYPDIKAAVAREHAKEVRALVKQGIDPVGERWEVKAKNIARSQDTFQVVATEWLAKNAGGWSASYHEKTKSALTANVFPRIGTHYNNYPGIDVIRDQTSRSPWRNRTGRAVSAIHQGRVKACRGHWPY